VVVVVVVRVVVVVVVVLLLLLLLLPPPPAPAPPPPRPRRGSLQPLLTALSNGSLRSMGPGVDLRAVLNTLPYTFTGADFYALASNALARAIELKVGQGIL
jgi:hypothetical protein